ncbi:TetR/AcrR family transcriptional regulator C-terminal domain-containing protein [Oryzifoliimicrobium ureilyticus]|uniref:TetR/AcrR family transcriptional regulator C-terminal domain-containing protein n=1 Tax=Oryzifoliimicrobium ureilyticus TaxID=3113724 RepID=UPI00307684D8
MHPAIATIVDHESPAHAIRGLASSLFDLLDDHPWIGSTLTRFPTQIAMIRLLEHLGGHIRAVGVHQNQEWAAASTLLMYMLGVGSQNAANAQLAREQALERSHFLDEVASAWSQLSADQYPFVQSNAERMRTHDDRDDFLTGIDFILKGIIAAGIR